MATSSDIRHTRLLDAIKIAGSIEGLSEKTGVNAAYLSQLKNKLPDSKTGTPKGMGDRAARKIEVGLKKPVGWMDTPDVYRPDRLTGIRDQRYENNSHRDAAPFDADGRVPPAARVPVVGTAQLGDDGYWLEMDYPVGTGDGWVAYPSRDPNTYAVRCKGDSMRPRIKPGEFVVAEPNRATSPGDEVLVKDTKGRIMVKVLNFRRGDTIELGSVNEDHRAITLDLKDVEYIHFVGGILKASMYYENMA